MGEGSGGGGAIPHEMVWRGPMPKMGPSRNRRREVRLRAVLDRAELNGNVRVRERCLDGLRCVGVDRVLEQRRDDRIGIERRAG